MQSQQPLKNPKKTKKHFESIHLVLCPSDQWNSNSFMFGSYFDISCQEVRLWVYRIKYLKLFLFIIIFDPDSLEHFYISALTEEYVNFICSNPVNVQQILLCLWVELYHSVGLSTHITWDDLKSQKMFMSIRKKYISTYSCALKNLSKVSHFKVIVEIRVSCQNGGLLFDKL